MLLFFYLFRCGKVWMLPMANVYDIDVEKHYVGDHSSLSDVFINWVFAQTLLHILKESMLHPFPTKSFKKQRIVENMYLSCCVLYPTCTTLFPLCVCGVFGTYQFVHLYITSIFVCWMICFLYHALIVLSFKKVCLFDRKVYPLPSVI